MTDFEDALKHQTMHALERLRARRGETRRTASSSQSGKDTAHKDSAFLRFIILQESLESERSRDAGAGDLSEIRLRLKQAREERLRQVMDSSREQDFDLLEEGSPETDSPSRRKQIKALKEDILSTHFRSNMSLWLSTVDPVFGGEHSTSIEEMEQIQSEAKYRHRLLKVMLDATQKEIDVLEVQIKALKAREEN